MSDGLGRGERPGDTVSEYGFACDLCLHYESWTTELACDVASIQHIRDFHPDVSRAIAADAGVDSAGIIMPPESFGRRLDDWESQL